MLGGRGREPDKVKWVIKTMKTKGRKEGDFTGGTFQKSHWLSPFSHTESCCEDSPQGLRHSSEQAAKASKSRSFKELVHSGPRRTFFQNAVQVYGRHLNASRTLRVVQIGKQVHLTFIPYLYLVYLLNVPLALQSMGM